MKSMNEEQFKVILGLYSKKGYRIIKDPEVKDEIPPFLSPLNYYPDYIIKSEATNYVVELSSSKNYKNENKMKQVIEEVEKNSAWEFILVVVDTPPRVEKPLPDVKPKKEKTHRHIKSDDDKPAPEIKPVEDKPAPVKEQKDKKPDPVPEPEDEKTIAGFEEEGEESEDDFETEIEMSLIDLDEEDIKPRSVVEPEEEKASAGVESINKGYKNLKLMIENKQFELYREPVLLFGWVLLESILRSLAGKEQTGADIGFLLHEAASDKIIDNQELSALKNIYLLRNKVVHGEFGIVTDKSRLDPLLKVVERLYVKHFS